VYTASAQSLTGTRGLVKIPTGRMYPDNTLVVGAGYVPPGIFKKTYGPYWGQASGNAGLNTFVTANILPFVEVMFRYSHEFNMQSNPLTQYFPDRMFTVRVQGLKETKYFPAVVLGLQDVSGAFDLSLKTASYSATYFVGTKNFEFGNYSVDTSLGYSFDFRGIPARDFRGLFGGIEVFTPYADYMSLMWEHDSQYMNVGVNGYFWKRLHVTVGLMRMRQAMWVLAYRYQM
ncbi:MAG: YjbH domain-containing protein, partial [Flavobacteriaceae bacterium]|nr:YjbH domain-containing protein [Flavobacteriaceae bacterium]